MASEMRRLAQALVAERTESFASRYPRAESERRFARAVEAFDPRSLVYRTEWRDSTEGVHLDVTTKPARSSRRFLDVSSILFFVLFAATAYVFIDPSSAAAERAMLAVASTVAILSFPLVVMAYGSRREAEEATLRRAIRKALVDADHSQG